METKIERLFSKKRVYAAIFICVLVLGYIYWNEVKSGSEGFRTLKWTRLTFWYLALALLFMTMRDLAYMVRIKLLTAKQLSWKQSLEIILLWEFASAISPGVVGGSAVAMFLLEREKIPLATGSTLIITTLILDNLFYILFIPLIFFSLPTSLLIPSNLTWLANEGMIFFWIGYAILVAISLLLAISIFISPKLIEFLVKLIFKLPYLKKKKLGRADAFITDYKIASKILRSKKIAFWIPLIGTTIWSWTARFLVLNCVLAAFIPIGFGDHLLILARQLVMWLGMLITPTPGGSGMAEVAFNELFADYVKSVGAPALGLALIWRTISYYPYLFIGTVLLPKWLRRTK